MFRFILYVTVKMKNIQQVLFIIQRLCMMKFESFDKETTFNETKATCKTQKFHILPIFLLITITLLTVVSIYCYLIKIWSKTKTFITISLCKLQIKNVYKNLVIKSTMQP